MVFMVLVLEYFRGLEGRMETFNCVMAMLFQSPAHNYQQDRRCLIIPECIKRARLAIAKCDAHLHEGSDALPPSHLACKQSINNRT